MDNIPLTGNQASHDAAFNKMPIRNAKKNSLKKQFITKIAQMKEFFLTFFFKKIFVHNSAHVNQGFPFFPV
ncbi:MAG: hypothetical protein GX776_01155 [Oxalobacter sp.]|nr:hypothetical protein [Oxalobacter sp.]